MDLEEIQLLLDAKQYLINKLHEEVAHKQSVIDRLMLEYCPDEMTEDQIESWERHQWGLKG